MTALDRRDALAECEQRVHDFFAFLDDGELDVAFLFHDADVAFFPPHAAEPLGRAGAIADAHRMRFASSRRRTVHVATGFVGKLNPDETVSATYLVTVYEWHEDEDEDEDEDDGDDGARERPEDRVRIFALARERVRFRWGDGAWRFIEQRMLPLSPLGGRGK